MPNYNQAHALYAGVDLHPRSMFVRVLNIKGKTVFENKAQHRGAKRIIPVLRKTVVGSCRRLEY